MENASQAELQQRVTVRMKELSSEKEHWHRSLWTVATTTTLAEVVEAAEHTWDGTLSTSHALHDFKSNAIKRVMRDPGVGTEDVRSRVQEQIKKIGEFEDAQSRGALERLREFNVRVDKNYLRNWAAYMEEGRLGEDQVELAARSLVSHIRAIGYSRAHVHGWLDSRSTNLAVYELAREAAAAMTGKNRTYRFVVPHDSLAGIARREGTLDVLDSDMVAQSFREASNAVDHEVGGADVQAGIELHVDAPDPYAALRSLELKLDKMLIRQALGTGDSVEPAPETVFERGADKIWPLHEGGQLLRLSEFRSRRLITATEPNGDSSVLDAVHLLAPHLQMTHGVSLATLWATCESILGRPTQGGHHVAEHLAAILTAVYPRHIAYDLSQRGRELQKQGHELGLDPKAFGTWMLDDFCSMVQDGGNPGFADPADLAALDRLHVILNDPKVVLKRVRQTFKSLFLRVYYHRNFLMHGGRFDAVSQSETSTIVPVIFAAALNEIVSGHARGITPSSLVERAHIELDLLGTPAEKGLMALLS